MYIYIVCFLYGFSPRDFPVASDRPRAKWLDGITARNDSMKAS